MEAPEGLITLRHLSRLGDCAKTVQDKANEAADILEEMAEALQDMEDNPYQPIGFTGRQALKKYKKWRDDGN